MHRLPNGGLPSSGIFETKHGNVRDQFLPGEEEEEEREREESLGKKTGWGAYEESYTTPNIESLLAL